MPHYIDGFVLAVPVANLPAYRKMAKIAGKIWKEHGALDYWECVGDDLDVKGMRSFRTIAKAKPEETVVFAWAVFRSRRDRDRANAKIMQDPRLTGQIEEAKSVFDCKRMAYGGFKELVRA